MSPIKLKDAEKPEPISMIQSQLQIDEEDSEVSLEDIDSFDFSLNINIKNLPQSNTVANTNKKPALIAHRN